jgi:hypothetical protein
VRSKVRGTAEEEEANSKKSEAWFESLGKQVENNRAGGTSDKGKIEASLPRNHFELCFPSTPNVRSIWNSSNLERKVSSYSAIKIAEMQLKDWPHCFAGVDATAGYDHSVLIGLKVGSVGHRSRCCLSLSDQPNHGEGWFENEIGNLVEEKSSRFVQVEREDSK